MISCLKGELFHKSPEKVTILVNGVGYEVFLSTASLAKLPPLGEEVFLYTYTYVREDILTELSWDSWSGDNGHSVTVTVKPVPKTYSFPVTVKNPFTTGECRNEKEQG